MTELISIFVVGIGLVFTVGLYSILTTKNIIRVLIAIEILMKAVTLLLIVAGNLTGQMALAQALVITLIVIEVAVMVVGVGIAIRVYRTSGTIDVSAVKTLKG